MKKTIFLDRDGTINIEKDYLHKIKDFEFESGVLEALRIFKELNYDVIVVTNQSGIARGYYTEHDLKELNSYMVEEINKNGGAILKCYYCPHHPEKGLDKYRLECSCRKPESGMLEEAIKEFNVDRENSYMVGDKLSDIGAGQKAHLKSILVKTGYGKKTFEKISEEEKSKIMIFENLLDFAISLKKNCF
ncbi:MAG: D-glycero-beta-D-manno-heptose 1,7-bisphosphate 7-phosphatase [Fusobacteriaceae bacterium]